MSDKKQCFHPAGIRMSTLTTSRTTKLSVNSSEIRTASLIMNKFIKFVQINKGDAGMYSRIEKIQNVISEHKPQVLVINEINLKGTDQISRSQFPNYSMEMDNLDVVDTMSRTGVLVHKNLHYKRHRDLESTGTSTIWLEFNYAGRKPLLFQALYCQFQCLGRKGSINPSAQLQRWTQIITKWESTLQEDKESTMGDCNLNYLRWDTAP